MHSDSKSQHLLNDKHTQARTHTHTLTLHLFFIIRYFCAWNSAVIYNEVYLTCICVSFLGITCHCSNMFKLTAGHAHNTPPMITQAGQNRFWRKSISSSCCRTLSNIHGTKWCVFLQQHALSLSLQTCSEQEVQVVIGRWHVRTVSLSQRVSEWVNEWGRERENEREKERERRSSAQGSGRKWSRPTQEIPQDERGRKFPHWKRECALV